MVAERLLNSRPIRARERNAIQDLIWEDGATPSIAKRYRRELAAAMDVHTLFLHAGNFSRTLDNLWVLDDPFSIFFGTSDHSLRAQIDRHVHRNPGDWSVEELFEHLGAFEASDRRFNLFLEALAASDVLPDENAQRRFVATTNAALRPCGVELREIAIDQGYPVFRVVYASLVFRRTPKKSNLCLTDEAGPAVSRCHKQ
jgi:hypothetical protein